MIEEYLYSNWDKLDRYVDLSQNINQLAIAKVISKNLLQKNLVSNKTLSMRIASAFVSTEKK